MNNRLSRILTRWINTHPTYGVRALLASAVETMDPGDQAALVLNGDDLPIAAVYNDVDDACMVKSYNPDAVPCVAIIPQVSTATPITKHRGQLDYDGVEVSLAYMERDQPELASRGRSGYVLTALIDSLIAFNDPRLSGVGAPEPSDPPDGFVSWRRLGDIEVVEMTAAEEFRMTLATGGASMFGAVVATFRVRRFIA